MKDNDWFDTEQIETYVLDKSDEDMLSRRKKLLVLHQCGDDKKALIEQLETMIYGLKTNYEDFGV